MSWHQHAPDPAERAPASGEEYVEHYEVPEGSGSQSSFATRHNEFPPDEGHAAAHDPVSGEAVLGDGTPGEELPAQWQTEAEGQDPAAAQVEHTGADDPQEEVER